MSTKEQVRPGSKADQSAANARAEAQREFPTFNTAESRLTAFHDEVHRRTGRGGSA